MALPTRPAKYALTVNQGATFRFQGTWLDENGDPENLTGCTASLVITKRERDRSPNPGAETATLLTLTTGDGITLGGVAGTIEIEMDDETTAALDWDKHRAQGVYDLYITFGSGDVVRLMEGGIVLHRRQGA
jgi:hypothetical protein